MKDKGFEQGILGDEVDNTPMDVVLFDDYTNTSHIAAIMDTLRIARLNQRNILFLHREPIKDNMN